jgi:hypothetical protein
LAVCAALSVLLAQAAAARAEPIPLLSPAALLMPPPPLFGGASPFETEGETRFPGHVPSSERVEVGLDEDGFVRNVVVTQRLLLARSGDYSFLIPAPATSVARTPASESEPGLRNAGIVWQGFSPGRRVLEAAIALSTREAEAALPLAISVASRGGATTVTLENRTGRRVTYPSGVAPGLQVRAVLARLRDERRKQGRIVFSRSFGVNGRPAGQATAVVRLPLRLRGTIAPPGRRPLRVSGLLEGRRTIVVPGRVPPRVHIGIDVPGDFDVLPRPADVAAASAVPLAPIQRALARTALSWQFRRYLSSPDPLGTSSATYVYRTVVKRPAAAPGEPERRRDTDDTLAIVLAATLGGAALLGLGVLWAYS